MKFNKKIVTALSTCALLLGANSANAAGYSSSLYSTSGLGNAYAGSVTGIHDASDLFFNPAVSVKFDKPQLIISASYLDADIDADNVSGASGGGIDDAGEDGFVPAAYFSTPINDKMAFGLSINSPFGLATKYNTTWGGRDRAIDSSIKTLNINPSLGYKINNKLSVGAGVVAQYYRTTLTKLSSNNLAKSKGSDWGYGYNLGLDYKYSDNLEFGIGYRSKIVHKIEGKTAVNGLGLSGTFLAPSTTPESLTVGLNYQATKKIEIAYDTTWTRWSRLNSFIGSATPASLNDRIDFGWKDSLLYSLGLNYKLNSNWLLRSGLAYETGAVTDARREPRVPTGDRVWLTAGFNYKLTNDFSIDAAYVHQFHETERVNLAADATTGASAIDYTSKTTVNTYSLGIKKEF